MLRRVYNKRTSSECKEVFIWFGASSSTCGSFRETNFVMMSQSDGEVAAVFSRPDSIQTERFGLFHSKVVVYRRAS